MKISRKRFHNRPRRGVLLLVVLSLLVLFVLSGLTFVVVTQQYRRTARQVAVQERTGDPPRDYIDETLYQILRDTTSTASSLRDHGILRDMYGSDAVFGRTLTNPTTQHNHNTSIGVIGLSGGEFVDVLVDLNTLVYPDPTTEPWPKYFDYYSGRLFTFVSGAAKSITTRIVDSGTSTLGTYVRLHVPKGPDSSLFTPSNLAEQEFVINGRLFSGAGNGFNPGTGRLDRTDGLFNRPLALFPNSAARLFEDHPNYLSGGADECYDAADFQNMFLAMLPSVGTPSQTIPSFHRPALINYWYHQLVRFIATGESSDRLSESIVHPAFAGFQFQFIQLEDELEALTEEDHRVALFEDPSLRVLGAGLDNLAGTMDDPPGPLTSGAQAALAHFKRQFILRPLREDHPNFTGSNPNFRTLVNSRRIEIDIPLGGSKPAWLPSWDIDNDGDGEGDSIWIDAGFPSQTTPDGRRFKPMVAILCVDMDGRLNLNAHGTANRVENRSVVAPVATGTTGGSPVGLGNGPPEIRLDPVIPFTQQKEFFALRYNSEVNNGSLGTPGDNGAQDTLARLKMINEPKHHWNGSIATSFTSPSDLHGELEHGMDIYGQLNFESLPASLVDAREDSPYEANLINRQASDRLFSRYELETVLRRFDSDAGDLPARLASINTIVQNHRLVTTHSYDSPVPAVPRGFIVDRMIQRMSSLSPEEISLLPEEIAKEIFKEIARELKWKLLWPAMSMNLPLDINRALGNGRDDNNNGIADDPMESKRVRVLDLAENTWDRSVDALVAVDIDQNLPRSFQAISFHHTNGLDPDDATLARHFLARHLYVLMMALVDQPSTEPDQLRLAREVAQWAINVVDFRDADSIMTPFEYDPTPFADNSDGDNNLTTPPKEQRWAVDGKIEGYLGQWSDDDARLQNVPLERDVVWGCERPELVISETLAFHDRRTEDRDDDNGVSTATDHAGNPDPDFDQRLVPRGSFFVELFNPWTSVSTKVPQELYRNDPNNSSDNPPQGVDLSLIARDPQTDQFSPVWRLAVTREDGVGSYDDPYGDVNTTAPDPDHPVRTKRPDLERRIYFTNLSDYQGLTPVIDPANSFVGAPSVPNVSFDESDGDYWTSIYDSTTPMGVIQPGRYGVIGSPGIPTGGAYVTPIGRATVGIADAEANDSDVGPMLDDTRRIILSPLAGLNNQVVVEDNVPVDPSGIKREATVAELNNLPAVAIVVNEPPLSISEPLGGYFALRENPASIIGIDKDVLLTVQDTPLDKRRESIEAIHPSLSVTDDRTIPNYRTVHLQRLADPQAPFNALTNPYLTIDSMRCDLTCFNGVTRSPPAGPFDPDTVDPNNPGNQVDNINMGSTQRGDSGSNLLEVREFWPQEPSVGVTIADRPLGIVDPPNTHHVFRRHMNHSLGYLNSNYWEAGNRTVPLLAGIQKTFGCLAWNNRPFVSHYELLNVPRTRSSQLLSAYSVYTKQSPYENDDSREFGHLWNFFSRDDGDGQRDETHAHRLFDFVTVPSRFIGTETLLNPKFFGSRNGITFGRLTPFSTIANYREPGFVNLNTISDRRVWNALIEQSAVPAPSYQRIVRSRRGYGETDQLIAPGYLDENSPPSFFANPFRSTGCGLLAPVAGMEIDDIDATLFRSEGDLASFATMTNPMVLMKSVVDLDSQLAPIRDTRNSCFRYELLRRLGNMVTTRSNVYAIWITIGYFELEPSPGGINAAHPDGFQLGQELGSDTGEVSRNRGFFLVDRSIPVAFEPGENHNVDDSVLLRRYIE